MLRKSAFALFAVLISAGVVLPDLKPAIAQEFQVAQARKRPGLFERLFGPRKKAPIVRKRAPVRKKSTVSRKRAPSRKAAPAVKAVEINPKDPNARKILVVGDFVAAGIGWGMEQALAKEPKLEVVDRYDGASGLVRADSYDWNEEILAILNEENPDAVVVVIGANDRQDLREDNQRFPVRSPKWEETYIHRIDGLVDTLKVYGRPFFWVSTPPMRGTSAMTDIAYFNELFKPRVEKAGGHFIDVWNGFTNASGEYITNGPDIDGQVKSLRTKDGINFSSAGKLKLAYYVERDIRRATGFGSGVVDLLASVTQSSTIEVGPDGKKRLVGPVISLSDPLPGAVMELAGAPDPVTYDPISGRTIPMQMPVIELPEEDEATPQYRLVVKGEALPAAAGRVDDFAWPPNRRTGKDFIAPAAAVEEGEAVVSEGEGEDGEAVLTPVSKSSE